MQINQNIQVNTMLGKSQCYAIAFNNENIMATGQDKIVGLWKFNEGIIIKIQELNGHQGMVSKLCFSKTNNILISTCPLITIIWSGDNQWTLFQTIPTECIKVQSILTDFNQSIIFRSTSFIQVWKQVNTQFIPCQTLCQGMELFCITLNSSCTSLAAFCLPSSIMIWKLSKELQWQKQQRIVNSIQRGRLNFFGDDNLILEEYHGIVHVYKQNTNGLFSETHTQSKNMQNYYYFDKQSNSFYTICCPEYKIFIQKYKNAIYIYKYIDNEFQLQDKIQFRVTFNNYICGALDKSAEYLTIFSKEDQQLLIYKLF